MATKLTEDINGTPKTTRTRRTAKSSPKKQVVQRSDDVIASKEVQERSVVENIKMLYNTIKDLKEKGLYQQIARLSIAQEENFARLASLNSELADEMISLYRVDENGNTSRKPKKDRNILNDTDNLLSLIKESEDEEINEILKEDETDKTNKIRVPEFNYEIPQDEKNYDIVVLPSGGECYPSKKGKLPVRLLTAADENIITSPALFRDGLVIDCLLKRKIMDASFDIDSLVMGDVDAITFFLRYTGYGADFPAKFTDPETNVSFDTVVDLTQIKMKDFKLKGDENGWFEFILPLSKDVVKFRYTTLRDERKLDKLLEYENKNTKAVALRRMVKDLDVMLDEQEGLEDNDDVMKLEDALPVMEKWADSLVEKDGFPLNKTITNRMEMMVMSVNGNTDRKFIKRYVRDMLAKDALELRRYMIENTPGMDFSIHIEKPESLGGGYIDTFLEWDANVFFSIA